jgi:large subunit ribosomal protein L19
MEKIKIVESRFAKKELPKFNVGDTVKVLTRLAEEKGKDKDKVRLHPFEGVVIAKSVSGINADFTVRKVSYGEGIERVFPLHSPSIERIEVVRTGKVKRAKLYYLRGKIGKRATKIAAGDEEPVKPAA